MPPAMPDPVLALSMASLQKLNTADVDQLANLWNVFTKCKESLASGRRLENLSWRLWFREAHLLPPDASLSDMTDFTPFDTPLTSRRGSITGSYSRTMALTPSQPSASLTARALQAAAAAMVTDAAGYPTAAPTAPASADLSDPEGSDAWSSEDDNDGEEQASAVSASPQEERRIPAPSSAMAGPSRSRVNATRSPPLSPTAIRSQHQPSASSSSRSITGGSAAAASSRANGLPSPMSPIDRDTNGPRAFPSVSVTTAQPGDRKRTISSSSAFGSRARVRQHNMQRRRRPLSFQQAIESMLLDVERNMPLRAIGAESNKVLDVARSMDDDKLPSRQLQASTNTLTMAPSTSQHSRPSTPMATTQSEGLLARSTQSAETRPASKFFVGEASQDGKDDDAPRAAATTPLAKDKAPSTTTKVPQPPSESGSTGQPRHKTTAHGHHAAHHGKQHGHHGKGVLRPTKSALSVHRGHAHGRPRPHVRIVGVPKDDSRAASPVDDADGAWRDEAKAKQGSQDVAQASTNAVETTQTVQQGKKRAPVTFTMGDDSDEDGSSGSDSRPSTQARRPAPRATTLISPPPPVQSQDAMGDSSDAWASDSSTDSEEVRRRTLEQRKREERERVANMFKKQPIRTQSAADLRLIEPRSMDQRETDDDPQSVSPAPPPIRSLLSTIFHPEQDEQQQQQQHGIGRGHASAADVRAHRSRRDPLHRKTSHEGCEMGSSTARTERSSEAGHSKRGVDLRRPPSVGTHLHLASSLGAGLKMSKSAAALPVLSTMGSRSSLALTRTETQGIPTARTQHDDESSEEDVRQARRKHDDSVVPSSQSEAVERLNVLAGARSRSSRSSRHRHDKVTEQQQDNRRRGSSASRADDDETASGDMRLQRPSQTSLELEVHPEVDADEMIRQQRRTSAPTDAPPAVATAPVERIPIRSRSAVHVPDVGLPQSPRTTRRNMLRDELSESLRQNLLWERQSRHRMLGIGAGRPTSTPQPAPMQPGEEASDAPAFPALTQTTSEPRQLHSTAHSHRSHSVLGGHGLRPLTQRSSTTTDGHASRTASTQGNNEVYQRGASRYTGDFHHTGW